MSMYFLMMMYSVSRWREKSHTMLASFFRGKNKQKTILQHDTKYKRAFPARKKKRLDRAAEPRIHVCLFVCCSKDRKVTHRIPFPRQAVIVQRIRMQVLSIDFDERWAVQIDGQRRASSLLLFLVQDLLNVLGTVACRSHQTQTELAFPVLYQKSNVDPNGAQNSSITVKPSFDSWVRADT